MCSSTCGAGRRGRPLNYAAVSRVVARTSKRVGFDFAPHDFRHTFVTLARRGGVRLEVISRLVTHRSVTTTADVDMGIRSGRRRWS
jgi:integrase